VALLARFACGCKLRVEIPAPRRVQCAEHGTVAVLIETATGQVRYTAEPQARDGEDAGRRDR
jgi:hypothetical protein